MFDGSLSIYFLILRKTFVDRKFFKTVSTSAIGSPS
jgi:hypothetical protein